jgi:DNA-binding response OmpR family regulator
MQDSTGPRILVVEESVLVAMELETVLAERGFDVVTAGNLMAAYMMLDTGTFAAGIVSSVLPDGRGEDLARELLAKGLPTALLVGWQDASAGAGLERARRFTKPIDDRQIAEWLERVLAPTGMGDQ